MKRYFIQTTAKGFNNTRKMVTLYEAMEKLQEVKQIEPYARIMQQVAEFRPVDENILMMFRGYPYLTKE